MVGFRHFGGFCFVTVGMEETILGQELVTWYQEVLDKTSIHVNNPETNKREPVFLVIWSRDTRMKYTYSSSKMKKKKNKNINSESGLKYKGLFHSRLEGHAANVTKGGTLMTVNSIT